MKAFQTNQWGQWEITEWIKFRVAHLLDRLTWLCWAELAMWAMNFEPWWTIFAVIMPSQELRGRSFRQSCRYHIHQEYPYCGKCWRRDRWLIGCTPAERAEALAKYPPERRPR